MLYAIHAVSFGLTEYSHGAGFELAEHKGRTLMLEPTGLLEQVGGAPATSVVGQLATGKVTLAGNQRFNVPKVSFAAEGAGTVSVEYDTQEDGATNSHPAQSRDIAEMNQHEMTLQTHQHARSYKFRVYTDSPGTKLETFDAYVNPVRHRRRN